MSTQVPGNMAMAIPGRCELLRAGNIAPRRTSHDAEVTRLFNTH